MASKKTLYNGIIYDSKFESEIAKMLDDKNIPYTRQPEYLLNEPFHYVDFDGKKRKYSKMIYTSDFEIILDDGRIIALEAKGYADKCYKIRKKLFIAKYATTHTHVQINTLKEMEIFLEKLITYLKTVRS